MYIFLSIQNESIMGNMYIGTTSINYVEYLDGNQTGGGTDPGGNPIQQ